MRTEKDLFTGATTYVVDTDVLEFSSFGPMSGSFRLICSADQVPQAVQVVTHPAPSVVREHAEELAEMADWELDPAELRSIREPLRVTLQATLMANALAPLRKSKVNDPQEALSRLRIALEQPAVDWVITDLEVDA